MGHTEEQEEKKLRERMARQREEDLAKEISNKLGKQVKELREDLDRSIALSVDLANNREFDKSLSERIVKTSKELEIVSKELHEHEEAIFSTKGIKSLTDAGSIIGAIGQAINRSVLGLGLNAIQREIKEFQHGPAVEDLTKKAESLHSILDDLKKEQADVRREISAAQKVLDGVNGREPYNPNREPDEPNGGQVPGADPGVGHNDVPDSFPVVLDLDRDGELALTRDAQGGWVGAGDGLLAVDRDGSGAIDDMSEVAFVEEDTRARTDLEGLAFGFDSNNDGVVNNQDERFSELQVFQDSNGNRVSDPGELMSLEEAGISSIDVSSMPYDGEPEVVAEVNGNRIFGYTDVTYDDGSTVMAGDVVLTANGATLDADVASMTNCIAGFGSNEGGVGCCDDHYRSKEASTPIIAGSN